MSSAGTSNGFFSLFPGEVRNLIYPYVGTSDTESECGPTIYLYHYPSRDFQRCMALAQTCREICSEYLPFFFQQNHFSIAAYWGEPLEDVRPSPRIMRDCDCASAVAVHLDVRPFSRWRMPAWAISPTALRGCDAESIHGDLAHTGTITSQSSHGLTFTARMGRVCSGGGSLASERPGGVGQNDDGEASFGLVWMWMRYRALR